MRVFFLFKSRLRNSTVLQQCFISWEKEGAPGEGKHSPTQHELGDGGHHPTSLRQLTSEPLRLPPLALTETGFSGPPQHSVSLRVPFSSNIENIGWHLPN